MAPVFLASNPTLPQNHLFFYIFLLCMLPILQTYFAIRNSEVLKMYRVFQSSPRGEDDGFLYISDLLFYNSVAILSPRKASKLVHGILSFRRMLKFNFIK